MNTQLAKNVFVDSSVSQYSEAISLCSIQRISVSATVFQSVESGDLQIDAEESNDGENWSALSGAGMRISTPGHDEFQATDLGMAFVRLRYTIISGTSVVVSCWLNTQKTGSRTCSDS